MLRDFCLHENQSQCYHVTLPSSAAHFSILQTLDLGFLEVTVRKTRGKSLWLVLSLVGGKMSLS